MASPFETGKRMPDEAAARDAGVSRDGAAKGGKGVVAPDAALGANFNSRRRKDIVFSVMRRVWRRDDDMASAHAACEEKRPALLARAGGRCLFCGFRSQHMEVHHCNDNHADNRDENLAIADPLCHGTQHIGEVGRDKHGVFIHFEGLPQAEVNHLQRTLAVVLEMGTDEQKAEARALLQHLASRAELVAGAWGSANPSDFAGALLSLHEEDADKRMSAFASMALLYRPVRFAAHVRRWIAEHYESLPFKTWKHIGERARTAR